MYSFEEIIGHLTNKVPEELTGHSKFLSVLAYIVAKQLKEDHPELKLDDLFADHMKIASKLHDLGKIIEFNGPVLTKYTNEGKLLGHISIGFSIVREYCEKLSINKEKAMLLQHMILSHHGKYEFGSPVLPMVKEALVLSMVDDLDAKEELCEQTLASVKKGEFSPRLFALEDRSIYNPNDD